MEKMTEQNTEKAALLKSKKTVYEEINWELVEHIRTLSVAEKNAWAFAAADFALNQKRLILTKENPDWNNQQIDQEARRQIFWGFNRRNIVNNVVAI